jgi:hypothetical protein
MLTWTFGDVKNPVRDAAVDEVDRAREEQKVTKKIASDGVRC